ncbi:MAG: hypothetical protein ACOC8F_06395, partial [Planctomycetota bacterium]
ETEGPATAPIPKKKLTRRGKLILAAALGGLVLAAGVTALVYQGTRAAERARRVKRTFEQAKSDYDAALPPANDPEKFAEAREGFREVRDTAGGSSFAARAEVLGHMAAAYIAAEADDWDRASASKQQAERAIADVRQNWSEGDWPEGKLQQWVRARRDGIDSFEDHLSRSRLFAARRRVGWALLAAAERLSKTRAALDGAEAPVAVEEVIAAREHLQNEVAEAYPDDDPPQAVANAVEALNRAERNLRDLPDVASAARRKDVLLMVESDIVPQAEKMIAALGEYAATRRQIASRDAFAQRVEAARTAVAEAQTQQQQRRRRRRVEELKVELAEMRDQADARLQAAVKRATERGEIEAAKQGLDQVKLLGERIHDWTVPTEAASMLGPEYNRELETYRDETFDALGERISQAEDKIKAASRKWAKVNELRDAKQAAGVAEDKEDWAAARKYLSSAVSLAKEVSPDQVSELQQRMQRATLRARLQRALELKADGKNVEAVAILDELLGQDPPEDIAKAARSAKKDAQSRVDWARLVDEGEKLRRRRKWEEALAKFEQAAAIRKDDHVRQRIAECKYHVGLAKADRLVSEGEFAAALDQYQQLKRIRRDAWDFLDGKIREVRKLQRFHELLGKGREALSKGEWYDARMSFRKAIEMYPDNAERIAPATKGRQEALYNEWLDKGKKRMAAEDYVSARAYFKNAVEHAATDAQRDQAQGFIDQAERAIADDEE